VATARATARAIRTRDGTRWHATGRARRRADARRGTRARGTSREDADVDVSGDASARAEAREDDEAIREERLTPEDELLAKIEARREAMFRRSERTRATNAGRDEDGVDSTIDREETRREDEREATTSGRRRDESPSRRRRVASAAEDPSAVRSNEKRIEGDSVGGRARREDTELVWVLERPGEGWGEQILPTIKAERRAVERPAPRRALSSSEEFLIRQIGLSSDEVVAALSAAAAWRTTKKGRALVDKRRMRLVQQNVLPCAQTMFNFGASKEDMAQIVRDYPIVLSLDTSTAWNMDFVEYVVRQKTESGGTKGRIRTKAYTGRRPTVKSIYRPERVSDHMTEWISQQRSDRDEGLLNQEQLYLLDAIGFDADRYVTQDMLLKRKGRKVWEKWFEELITFQQRTGLTNPPYEEGVTTGLGAWLEEQRELYRIGELVDKREERLRAQGIAFDSLEALEEVKRLNSFVRDTTIEPVENILANTQFTQLALELRAFLNENGEYAEPNVNSPLGVWVIKTRAKVRDGTIRDEDMQALEQLNLDMVYIPESWVAMLNVYADMRARRSNSLGVDIMRVKAWQREQLDLMRRNDGSLTQAQVNRLRHVAAIDNIAGFASNAVRSAREERAREFAEFEARVAARKARLEALEKVKLSIDEEQDEEHETDNT